MTKAVSQGPALSTPTQSRHRSVVINGRFLSQPLSGVQRFAWEVICAMDAIRQAEPEHDGNRLDLEILCPPQVCPLPCLHTIGARAVGRMGGYAWEQIELPWAARGRLVLNLSNLGPVLARKITTIHDAIVWLMPENYTPAFVAAYRLLLPLIARTSRHCVTVSEHSRRCLMDFGVTGSTPVTVVGNGIDHILHAAADDAATPPVDWPERFVFALGNAAPNKNSALLRTLAPRLRQRGIATVIAGGGNSSVFADASGGHSGIVALGRVPDAIIRQGYRRALAFIFPSFHEGFGIPPVEAMALGCPVVASQSSAMPEILGDAALLCDPRVPRQWLDAILEIAATPALRASLVEKGHARAQRYRWENSARRMLGLLLAATEK